MMNIIKPKFWDKKKGILSSIFLPLAAIYYLILFLKKNFSNPKDCNIPIICIGNIYIGGTGKTPISIYLSKELTKLNKNPVIIRKYYKNHHDEYDLIKTNFQNLITSKDRLSGIYEAKKNKFKTVILDDGFQDYSIKKRINVICFNQPQLAGNELIIPAGPLRETLKSLKDAQIVIINGNKNINFEEKILNINNQLNIFYTTYEPINFQEFEEKKLLAIAGIGNPNNFFNLLLEKKLKVEKKIIFPDHYKPNRSKIQNLINLAKKENLQIITTEKDFLRFKDYGFEEIKYLKIKLKFEKKNEFIEKIMKIYD